VRGLLLRLPTLAASDGTVWKVRSGEYNYVYAYYASVTPCDGTLIFKDKTIKVTQLK
jgi:hypothetical protein